MKKLNKVKNFKKREGITITFLAITIVIMFILIGVSMRFITNEKGVLTETYNATRIYNGRELETEIRNVLLLNKGEGIQPIINKLQETKRTYNEKLRKGEPVLKTITLTNTGSHVVLYFEADSKEKRLDLKIYDLIGEEKV